ncbi:hypothetical protein KIPB_011564, partial [Kipferlia bialata]|eukprot:g11564.t1
MLARQISKGLVSSLSSCFSVPALKVEDRVFPNIHGEEDWHFESAVTRGSWGNMDMSPEDITEQVMLSELRGRGGAGFSTAQKWSFLKPLKKPK